ncbi:MAG: HlyD family efflux transporter periplasmic adaptor subunit [Planctomycetia bacterium]|nr:HlyD family efflux transporter periplasmic adaptor subunit [Planctomycetia bacterium]
MKNQNKIFFLFIGIIIGVTIMIVGMLLFGNGQEEVEYTIDENTINDQYDDKHNEEIVKLTDSEIQELGIIIGEVDPQTIQLHSDLTGEIIPDPTKVAHLVPRFAGIVREVRKNIGDDVKKDEVIAVIESNESLVQYEVKSSIAGTVIEMHMTPGEVIDDDKHAITVADLSSVWASLTVYQKDLTKIKVEQNVDIITIDESNVTKSKIFYVSPIVDEETRTSTARVNLNNTSGFWKPGMFISGKVFITDKNVPMAVNKNALQTFNGKTVVFVKDEEGFRPQVVSIGLENGNLVEILSGLRQGQKYVAEGAFTIKSEFLKESFGSDHD